jgi:hypothetical protein
MGLVVPKVRKHLSGDALFGSLRTVFADLADHRQGDADLPLRDALLSAFALFSRQSPSLLAFDQARTADNVQRVYGIGRVPGDTSMRERRDPGEPASLRPALTAVVRQLQRGQALAAMVCVAGHSLCALAGTGSGASTAMHGDACLAHHHRHGTVTYSHQMVGAALIHPDTRAVMPLRPAPSITQEGATKHACARNAATRCLAKLRQDHPHLTVLVTADSLRANAPHIETVHEHDLPSI